jgi:hypothetical protein
VTQSRNLIRKKWQPTAVDIELVRRNFANSKTDDLAAACGVVPHQITRLAKRLGLKKDEAWLSGPSGGRLDGVKGSGTRFQKGQAPWSAGKKFPGRVCATSFKPGQKPANFLPVGSFRVTSGPGGGYLQIKLTETGYPPRDWVMYHRYVWEQAHGPIPDDHLVEFKGPRSTDPAEITVNKLECISKLEHIRRNTIHNYPAELVQVMQLRGAITRQINKRAKDAA